MLIRFDFCVLLWTEIQRDCLCIFMHVVKYRNKKTLTKGSGERCREYMVVPNIYICVGTCKLKHACCIQKD